MEKTTLYLPSELNHALKVVARRKGRPQAAVMREALEAYVRQQERPRLLSQGIAEDAELNGVDTEDWLKANWRPS